MARSLQSNFLSFSPFCLLEGLGFKDLAEYTYKSSIVHPHRPPIKKLTNQEQRHLGLPSPFISNDQITNQSLGPFFFNIKPIVILFVFKNLSINYPMDHQKSIEEVLETKMIFPCNVFSINYQEFPKKSVHLLMKLGTKEQKKLLCKSQ